MDGPIRKRRAEGEIVSLNLDDLDMAELERRLEMAVALTDAPAACPQDRVCECNCPALQWCGCYCLDPLPQSARW